MPVASNLIGVAILAA